MNELFPLIKNNDSIKKAWLDYLYYEMGKQKHNFHICSLFKTIEGDSKSSKWKKYLEVVAPLGSKEHWRLKYYNQRQILPNEIVLDLEEKETLQDTINKLENLGVIFYVFDTNSRGYHIHIFFDRKLSRKRKAIVIQEFNADLGKCADKTLIAMAFSNHWKSGKLKELVYHNKEV